MKVEYLQAFQMGYNNKLQVVEMFVRFWCCKQVDVQNILILCTIIISITDKFKFKKANDVNKMGFTSKCLLFFIIIIYKFFYINV